jgi:hypothetical protein
LIHLEANSTCFSERQLISLKVLPDFDSTIRRFDPSRPCRSLNSQIGRLACHFGKSLRPNPRKLSFPGDGDRSLGSIATAARERQAAFIPSFVPTRDLTFDLGHELKRFTEYSGTATGLGQSLGRGDNQGFPKPEEPPLKEEKSPLLAAFCNSVADTVDVIRPGFL